MSHRLFLDSSVFYAAIYSSTGAAREIIRWSIQGKVQLVASQDVLEETQRNIARKAPEIAEIYRFFLALLSQEIVPDPTKSEVREADNLSLGRMLLSWLPPGEPILTTWLASIKSICCRKQDLPNT